MYFIFIIDLVCALYIHLSCFIVQGTVVYCCQHLIKVLIREHYQLSWEYIPEQIPRQAEQLSYKAGYYEIKLLIIE